MVCCQSCGFDEFFNEKHAARELKRYHRKGAIRSTKLLVDLLAAEGVTDATLLDIGGGIGAIQHELLRAGAASSVDVDGSRPYLDIARAEAERQGHAERTRFELGDFADVADGIEPADVVTLDRVICCYPDAAALIEPSAARARRLYGLVFPRPTLPMRIARPIVNAWSRLRRCPLRFFLHPSDEVDRLVRAAGLTLHERRTTFLWQVLVYRRDA